MRIKSALLFLVLFTLCSCAPRQEIKKDSPEASAVAAGELPRVVAVMPFQNETQEIGIASQLRKTFYNHFSSKPFRDIELPVVDEKIVHLEKSSDKSILQLPPEEICKSLECEGIIYGRVLDYKKVYAGVYSQLGIEAEIWMVNAKTGKESLRLKDSVRYHEGGVPLSPLGAVMTAVSTAMNIREIQQVRMTNELCYKFVEKIPSPEGLSMEDRPAIREVLTNVKEGPFGKGKIIRVGLEGEKGLVAFFDIGNFRKGIPMKETKPGIYLGEYLVMPGDNSKDMPVIAYLKRPGGFESQWIDAGGFATIDTTSPHKIKGLRARGFQDRVDLSWEGIKDTPDLKGYIVTRSELPLSGHVEMARIETNSWEDKNVKPGVIYYYRVSALDQAGNESDPVDSVRCAMISKEPVVLAGELTKDTVLAGIYIIRGELKVPRGLTLSIEPETRIMMDEGASLSVLGSIIAGSGDNLIEFSPSGDKRWKGILIDGGQAMMKGIRLQGAAVAIHAINAQGTIENGIITGNDTGILISGTPSITLHNTVVSSGKTGIELQKTGAKIFRNTIVQNTEGIILKGFSGEIRDNIIIDNTRNITSESLVKIDPNYFGTVNSDEMRTSNITTQKVYESRPPDGKIVDTVSNPYAVLSLEDRKKRAAEIIIEAGGYFRQRNYGKASALFEEALKAEPSSETYYYLALCYQEMKDDEKALKYLKEGSGRFPKDSTLVKSLGLLYYEKGSEDEAKKAFEEVIRLSPEDRQVKFLLERIRR
jgi:hypothetical protein